MTDESASATLTTGASSLLARIRDVGLGANVDYPPLFAATVFFLLMHRLVECADGELLQADYPDQLLPLEPLRKRR